MRHLLTTVAFQGNMGQTFQCSIIGDEFTTTREMKAELLCKDGIEIMVAADSFQHLSESIRKSSQTTSQVGPIMLLTDPIMEVSRKMQ